MYSTGNYIQYLIINYNGKESEKEYIYIYIYIHTHIYIYNFAVHQKVIQYCKSSIL